jgi:NAD(P)-dependent dehydrogenase (short-subunit alcohol dehydrogenase family)
VARPSDVAAAVAFPASDEAAFVTGAILPADGGFTAT